MNLRDTIQLVGERKPNVLVVGDAMVDEYLFCSFSHKSHEADVPVVLLKDRALLPGGAGNVACGVAALGGEAELVSVAGNLSQAMKKYGINPHFLGSRPIGVKTRVMVGRSQLLRVDEETTEPISRNLEDEVLGTVDALIERAGAVVLSDYAKGVCTPRVCQSVICSAHEWHIPVVVDPKGADHGKYRGATVLKPNQHEYNLLYDAGGGKNLMDLFPGSHLLVTQDGQGMVLLYPFPPITIDAVPIPEDCMFDPTGAGDTVAAGLAVALASGADVESAARFANLAAGLVVRKPCTAIVTLYEMLAELSRTSQ